MEDDAPKMLPHLAHNQKLSALFFRNLKTENTSKLGQGHKELHTSTYEAPSYFSSKIKRT